MGKQQPLSLINIEGGELVDDVNQALQEVQQAVLGKKGKGAVTIKITVDASKSDFIAGVGYEISKTAPKLKKASLYNKGETYLVAEPVQIARGTQDELPGMSDGGNVVSIRQQA